MPKADTKTKILDAAEMLFAQKGFDAVSLRNIVESAKVNLAAVHYHFGSKQTLLHKVVVLIIILKEVKLKHKHLLL